MFLIDDEDANIRKRGEHPRARADDHARLARADAPPLVEMLALRKAGMEDGRVRAEDEFDALDDVDDEDFLN